MEYRARAVKWRKSDRNAAGKLLEKESNAAGKRRLIGKDTDFEDTL